MLVWLALAGLTLWLAARLSGQAQFGPSPAFFARYLSFALLALAGIRAIGLAVAAVAASGGEAMRRRQWQSTVGELDPPADEADTVLRRPGLRFAVLVAALFAYAFLLEILGFILATAALGFITMTMLGRRPFRASIECAVGSVLLWYGFTNLLGVPLPGSSIGILRALGL